MKQPRRVLGNLLAMVLTLFSLHALAETQTAGRNFDHSTTGFPLTGVHATTACETCHVAGVFKGTAKTCDGCHSLGKRIVATPKSTSHIVTDAPCDSCHFNSYTFQGARYNHGTALPGQCVTCHNNRITTGRPANHSGGLMLSASCDKCHRTYAFLPASFDHPTAGIALGGHTCKDAGCHVPGTGNRYTLATATSPVSHTYTDTSSQVCDVCHISFMSWSVTQHEPGAAPGTGTCATCHNGSKAQTTPAGHIAIGTSDCDACHTSTVTWLGALGAMPSNHIPSTLWTPSATCGSCHPAGLTQGNAVLHNYIVVSPCTTCHLSPAKYLSSVIQTKSSSHTNGKDCTGCHTMRYSSWNSP